MRLTFVAHRNCLLITGMFCMLTACTINIYQNPAESLQESSPESRLLSSSLLAQLNGRVPADSVLDMEAFGPRGSNQVIAGDPLTLRVRTAVDAYISCYYQQNDGDIYKLFPNRYAKNYRLTSEDTLLIPSADQYKIVADSADKRSRFMCLMSGEDIQMRLPLAYRANRFQRVPVANFDSLYELFRSTTDQNLVARVTTVAIQ